MTLPEAHDPTASATTYAACPADLTQLSRNEVETLCLKAARGAGLSWGLAEEAGFAIGWLTAQGVDGATALLAHLAGWAPATGVIDTTNRLWRAASHDGLCPIAAGAALEDHAQLDAGPYHGGIGLQALRHPLLVLPFLARMAQASQSALAFGWSGGTVTILPGRPIDPKALLALGQIAQDNITVAPAAAIAPVDQTATKTTPCAVPAATLAGLNALSMRTTVPASEQSRRGAGGTTSDND
ncbi:DUF3726 domain-containing protein [Pseudotabrizicola sp. L79]|uniref:DUF3726 domain-containing protein n=1 Tax=Pseudotabrizicola sp. L79 TaxID=3118402 RepID=UPI002F9252CC